MSIFYDIEEYEEYYRSRDKKGGRVILHSDLNNFFASVETLFSKELKKVPLAICGDKEARHGIVLAKNELAKKYGVKTGDTISLALKKCPFLVTRPCRYEEYVKESRRVREIYLSFATRVESFGIDEAWLDVTDLAEREKDEDVFSSGERIAHKLRERVKAETGLTVSVGVSFNKTFSKLASDMKKPDAVTVISFKDYREKVWGLPVESLLFVGRRTKEELKTFKIATGGDLARQKRILLKNELGKSGELLWDTANGFDLSPVEYYHKITPTKSVSVSTTMPYDATSFEEANSVISTISDGISEELRHRNTKGGVVKLFVKFSDLSSFVRQEKLPERTYSSLDIYLAATSLFKENVDFSRPVRALGVGVDDFAEMSDEQMSIFSGDTDSTLDRVLDKTREKFGDRIIQRASVMKNSRLSEVDKKHVCFNAGL